MGIDLDKSWEELSEDEQNYLNDRHALKVEWENARYLETTRSDSDDEPDEEESEEEYDEESDEGAVEEWVAQATKAQIVEQLQTREIAYDRAAKRDELAVVLLEAVRNG